MGSVDPVFRWRKSSRSGQNGQCVEVGREESAWRKSSRSGQNGECVELANFGAVRDSKNPDGPLIRADIESLLGSVKADQLRR